MHSVEEKAYKNEGNAAVVRCVPATARTILDIGCGAGDNARLLTKTDRIIDGITISISEREFALKHCQQVVIHNLESGLPDGMQGPYDCVVCSHVLEHICWPEKLLRDIRKRLSPEGRLVVALPNIFFYKNRWNLIRGRFDYEEAGLMDNTHFRWYSFRSAQALLTSVGFEVLHAGADGSFPIPFRRRLFSRLVTKPVDAWAAAAFPGLFGHQIVFVARSRQ